MTKNDIRERLTEAAMERAHAQDSVDTLNFFRLGGKIRRNDLWRKLTEDGITRLYARTLPDATLRLDIALETLEKARTIALEQLRQSEVLEICARAERFYAVHRIQLREKAAKVAEEA